MTTEIVGAGDIIRPWETSIDERAVIDCSERWIVVEPTRVAVLRTPGRGFLLASAAREELGTLCREGERGLAPAFA